MSEVTRSTADGEGVTSMMAFSSAVSDMMALLYRASQREIDDAWLVTAHRSSLPCIALLVLRSHRLLPVLGRF